MLMKICDSASASLNSSILASVRELKKSSDSPMPSSRSLFAAVKSATISARPDSPDQLNSESIAISSPSGSSTACISILRIPPTLALNRPEHEI